MILGSLFSHVFSGRTLNVLFAIAQVWLLWVGLFRCREFKRFMAESEERDAREDDEAREILSHPELYPDGVLF